MSLDIELPELELELELDEELLNEPKTWRGRFQQLSKKFFGTPLAIAGSLLLIILLFGVFLWNLSRLEILDELARLKTEEYRLDIELEEVMAQLDDINVKQLQVQIQDENERVFHGFPELAAWAEGLARYAGEKGVNFRFRATNVHPSPVPEVLEIPLVLEFVPLRNHSGSLFADAMTIVNTVLRDHWHIDVIATSAEGDGKELRKLSLEAQVWVRDRYGFVDLDALSTSTTTLNEQVPPLDDGVGINLGP
ncbi:MAG: hypothetical protein AAGG11_21860 [Pseudomonadota bacterium]